MDRAMRKKERWKRILTALILMEWFERFRRSRSYGARGKEEDSGIRSSIRNRRDFGGGISFEKEEMKHRDAPEFIRVWRGWGFPLL
jgi:hypothetical protein